jgi:uncharacterized protein (UPF0264 family)
MTQHQSTPEKAGLLVSVRSLEEANIAHRSNVVTVIDVKEPTTGSLGCVSLETAQSIADGLPRSPPKSIALGEVIDWPIWPSVGPAVRNEVLSKYQYVKLGLSGLAKREDWVNAWLDCLSQIPAEIDRVAVAYADAKLADSPPIELVINEAATVGCKVLLVDTFSKSEGCLFDHLTIAQLEQAIQQGRSKGLKIVLAGSLSHANMPDASRLQPDLIAVRGAVCQGDRTSTIDLARICQIATIVEQLNH